MSKFRLLKLISYAKDAERDFAPFSPIELPLYFT